ncbi:pentatricopeptide repeat-containing protein At3g16010 [Typha latifolia]|uniref:pentatricopeptide repeat-containing protein At3g16010 n=1 Tax=Typha latifolia TaxID=4733 RepID=UPI003C2D25CE
MSRWCLRRRGALPSSLVVLLSKRLVSSSPQLSRRLKQTENEIVQMFRLPNPRDETATSTVAPRYARSARPLDERFVRILKIFKWGPDAEKALEVLMLRVDHRLVREVLKTDVDINVKIQFFRWAGKRKNFEHDSYTYMALIHCLDEAGLVGEMWKTVLDMVRSPCIITPVELSDIIRILGRAKMVNKACSIFYQIKTRKCQPSSNAYNSMIIMLMQEGHHEKVHELYNEMCNDGHCFPDTVTYTALISTFCKLGRADSAVRLFEEMKENRMQPPARMYTTLISMFFKSENVEEALSLFREMRDQCCIPNVFTYTELIKGLGKAGRVDEAYDFFLEMQQEGCRPDTVLMNNMINILGKAGRLDDAIRLFEEMETLQCIPTVVTYNTVIKALFESKSHASDVASWFEKMKQKGIAPSSFTYSILIDGFCKTNRVEKALMLLEEMDEKGFPPCPAAYCSLIDALGKAKRYEAASELFQELKENCGSSTARVYAVMIKHLGKGGRLNDAMDLFDEMKKLGCNPNIYAYNALMSGMVRVGMIDEPLSILRTMQEQGCVPDINSYNIILNGLGKTGGPQRAMEMLSNMKLSKIKPDAVSYNTVLGALSHAGMFEEAAKLMKEMNTMGFEYDLITYSSILEAIGKIDDEPTDSVR